MTGLPGRRRKRGRSLQIGLVVLAGTIGISACTSGAKGVEHVSGAPSQLSPARPSASGPRTPSLATDRPVSVPVLKPVPLRSPARLPNGVSVTVTALKDEIEGDTGPGILHGRPAIGFTLTIRNGSSKTIHLDTVEVNASYGKGVPAVPANKNRNEVFSGPVAAGAQQSALYSFSIPTAQRGRVKLMVTYSAVQPTAIFVGAAR